MNRYSIELLAPHLTRLGINAIEDSYRTLAIDILEYPGLLAIASGCSSPFLNVVIDTRDKTNGNLYLQEMTAFFKKHNVPWTWMLTGDKRDTVLEKSGLKFLDQAPSMYFDLGEELSTIHSPLNIQAVNNTDDLKRWIEPLCEAFPSDDNGAAFLNLNSTLQQQGNKTFKHFIGLYQNEVVAAGSLFLSQESSVMLHSIGTKTAYQRRGFGSALTHHLMQEAKQLGYKHCFLDSSDEGFKVYQRLGFKIYSTLAFYQIAS